MPISYHPGEQHCPPHLPLRKGKKRDLPYEGKGKKRGPYISLLSHNITFEEISFFAINSYWGEEKKSIFLERSIICIDLRNLLHAHIFPLQSIHYHIIMRYHIIILFFFFAHSLKERKGERKPYFKYQSIPNSLKHCIEKIWPWRKNNQWPSISWKI